MPSDAGVDKGEMGFSTGKLLLPSEILAMVLWKEHQKTLTHGASIAGNELHFWCETKFPCKCLQEDGLMTHPTSSHMEITDCQEGQTVP